MTFCICFNSKLWMVKQPPISDGR